MEKKSKLQSISLGERPSIWKFRMSLPASIFATKRVLIIDEARSAIGQMDRRNGINIFHEILNNYFLNINIYYTFATLVC